MAKCKVSVTVDAKLIERLDRVAGPATRSQVVEEALAMWVHNRRLGQLETEIERYYTEMSATERAEDAVWAEEGLGHLTKTWG